MTLQPASNLPRSPDPFDGPGHHVDEPFDGYHTQYLPIAKRIDLQIESGCYVALYCTRSPKFGRVSLAHGYGCGV